MHVYALQALVNAKLKKNEAMSNLTRINLTLSQRLTPKNETILVLSKQLQEIQALTNSKKPATKKPATDKKNISKSEIDTYGLMEGSTVLTIPAQHAATPRKNTKRGKNWITGWEELASGPRKINTMNRM